MLCPAAASAAAAVWLLAALGPGLSLSAEDVSEPGFARCFHRGTPPRGDSAGPLHQPLCHRLPGGQAFATLSRPACDTAIYCAFRLGHGGSEGEAEEEQEEELLTGVDDNIKVAVPALLNGGGGDQPNPVSPTDSLLRQWDSTVTTLVQSSIGPRCSSLEGDLYILTGAGGLRASEDEGDEACQLWPLWFAACCDVPEGKGGFSVGLIRETEEGEKQVSIKELEELLGMSEMFSEDCGGAGAETDVLVVGLASEENPENVERRDAEASGEEKGDKEENSDTADSDTEGVADVRVQPEEAEEVTQDTSAQAAKSESSSEEQEEVRPSGAVRSESSESSADNETVDEQEEDTNSTSTVVYILSTIVSIIKAPLHPVVSTATQLPGQVTYVLQEDLGVLSTLPGDTFSLFHHMTSDLFSWMRSAGDFLLDVGDTCFSSVYFCTSSMVGELYNNCHTGVTGVGTLASDTVGIFGGALDNAWWVTKFFGGRMWEQSEGYVGTVVSEMGGQAKAVGGGFGKLVWRSGNGAFNVFRLGGGFLMGIVDMFVGAVRGAFGQESE